jgi:hypothetical protein
MFYNLLSQAVSRKVLEKYLVRAAFFIIAAAIQICRNPLQMPTPALYVEDTCWAGAIM